MPIELLPGGSIQANSITTTQMNSETWSQVYSALATANTGYSQANSAYAQANAAYNKANTAGGASIGLVIALS